jgi:hypothetical protein
MAYNVHSEWRMKHQLVQLLFVPVVFGIAVAFGWSNRRFRMRKTSRMAFKRLLEWKG